jgi:hypothetical protein
MNLVNTKSEKNGCAPHLAHFLAAILAVTCLSGCLRMSTDAQALRDSVMNRAQGQWDERFSLGVGPVTLGLARIGLRWVDLDPEVRLAVDSIKGADVGVYHCSQGQSGGCCAQVLADADRVMRPRGWERIVTVQNRQELVMIYLPSQIQSARDVKICVLTQQGRDLVVASARSNLEPILELAARKSNKMTLEKNGS